MGYLSVGMFERESIESSLPVFSDGDIHLHEGTATRISNRGVDIKFLPKWNIGMFTRVVVVVVVVV